MLNNILYLVMAILQCSVVCLVLILWASILAFFPMELGGSGGILGVCISCRFLMSGLLWRVVWG